MRMKTREDVIREALAANQDPHIATAAYFLQIPAEQVTQQQRQAEKAWNHAYTYGAPASFYDYLKARENDASSNPL